MVVLDQGTGLRAALLQMARRPGNRATLYLLAPFVESDSELWRTALAIVRAGVRVIVFTRPTDDDHVIAALRDLTRAGGRSVAVANLHAKAFLWLPDSPKSIAAYIGSHNLTRSSETFAIELGILIWGEGWMEMQIYSALRRVISGLTAPPQARRARCRTRVNRKQPIRKEPRCH